MPAASTQPTADPVPLVPSLDQVYSPARLAKEGLRWASLTETFKQRFGRSPHFVARAPGRVNIIGEHIDHMGFSVLPAALDMDILMAVAVERSEGQPKDDIEFQLGNTTQRFQATSFSSSVKDPNQVQLDHQGGARWANYFKVAFKGLHPHLPQSVLDSSSRPARIQVLVDGTIPPESSLSSSAAMTSCSSIVVLEAFQARELISRKEMAEVAIESERLVGVNSGGMDQAASIFGIPGHALNISFVPSLEVVPIKLPPSDPAHTFVIANTLVVSDKKVMGPVQYNLRVAELRMAARVLCQEFGLPKDASTLTLKRLMEVYFAKNPLPAKGSNKAVDEAREKYGDEAAKIVLLGSEADARLPQQPLSRTEVEKLTGYEGASFDKEFTQEFPIRADTFKLHARTKHVFAEALRVLQFRSVASSASASSGSSDSGASTYKELGRLMDASQESLMADYENGCPELLEVVDLARKAGSLGSRATGAGWGGSTVHLVPTAKVDEVRMSLVEGFYKKRYPELTKEQIDEAILVSQPARGACVYLVDDKAAAAAATTTAAKSGEEGQGLLGKVKQAMGNIAPLALADTTWDNVGLLVEAPFPRPNANSVLLAIDLTTAVADEILAPDSDIGVAVVYHPIIFRGLKSLTLSDPQQRSILRLISAGVSVYTPHTALDSTPDGINDWLALGVSSPSDGRSLGEQVKGFAKASTREGIKLQLPKGAQKRAIVEEKKVDRPGAGMGRVVTLEKGISIEELARRVKGFTGCRTVQVARPDSWTSTSEIRTIALCAGSGGSVFRGVQADAYVTGELSHHEALSFTASNRVVILTNHSNTERGYLRDVLRPLLQLELDSLGGGGGGGAPSGAAKVKVSTKDHDPLDLFVEQ